MSTSPTPTPPARQPNHDAIEPWPEIDRLPADAQVHLDLVPTWYAGVKVLFDYLTALALLPFALPLIALAGVAIKLTSPGPVFYTQIRLGLGGRRYNIIKLRSMPHNCEAKTGPVWSPGSTDNRPTPVGKILRKTHIDELPQLFNVLMGQMSLVGPRPERPEVINSQRLNGLVPGYRHRLAIKPGVTGLAQVQVPADTDITSVRHKVVYDLYYAEHQGLFLDLRLIAATAAKAAGLGPQLIRRLFLLPDRPAVAEVFATKVVPPADGDLLAAELQPA